MDYSLFLIKISLNKEEMKDIFGENIKQKQNKDINNLLSSQMSSENDAPNIKKSNNIDNNNNDNSILKIEDLKNSYKEKEKFKDIEYYKQYLYPSLIQGTGYIISIIDYFQYFNFFKVVEAGVISKFKTGLSKKNNNTISCVDPKTYSERFIKYFTQLTDITDMAEEDQEEYNDEIQENNNENDNEGIKTNNDDKDDEKEEVDIFEDVDNCDNDSVKININEQFHLRITIMNKNLIQNNYLNRITNFNFKRNNSKFNV